MKLLIFLLTLSLSLAAASETIKKWTDAEGKVHYGDKNAAEFVKGTEALKIKDTYDQQAYDEGVERYKETKEIGDQLEKERIREETKRKLEESKPASLPPSSGRGIVINPPLIRNDPYLHRPSRPGSGNRPVQLPAKRK